MNKLQTVENKKEFAQLLGYKNFSPLSYVLYKLKPENLYEKFEIDKKSGGKRTICAPKKELKTVQKKLATLLWTCYQKNLSNKSKKKFVKKDSISHAFEKEKSIITNAKQHRNKNFVLNIDLADYFDSFHFGRVKGYFEKNKDFRVPPEIALIIAQLTCYEGKLPQGAPSSPIITNLISQILDRRIVKLSKKYKLTYTRYADDLTFSTNEATFFNDLELFLEELEKVINRSGFKINPKKTRISDKNERQEVTGLIVNKKINIKREYFKNTKAMAFNLYKDGEFLIDGKEGTIDQLNGRFAFIHQIERYNNYLLYKKSLTSNNIEHQKYLLPKYEDKKGRDEFYWDYIFTEADLDRNRHYNEKHDIYNIPKDFYKRQPDQHFVHLERLSSKEKEYQKFLFFKYFYGNDKPVIVTEGKTDSRYLKAALKKNYLQYPELIKKNNSGEFLFKVNFLRHSPTVEYFFNAPKGGESFKYFYNFFSDNTINKINAKGQEKENAHIYKNYYSFFKNLTTNKPLSPTIFLFDNEPPSNPLSKFLSHAKINNTNFNNERNPLYYKDSQSSIIPEGLFILSTPLLPNNISSDIEDLLIHAQSMPVLNNKPFNKKGGAGFYGKDILSKHVLKNYDKFNFKHFELLLNKIQEIVKNY